MDAGIHGWVWQELSRWRDIRGDTGAGHEGNEKHMHVGRNTRLEEDPWPCLLEEWKLGNSSDIRHGAQANKQRRSHGMAVSVTGKTRVSEGCTPTGRRPGDAVD